MASRRKLKKAIRFVSTELITEMYILSLFKKIDGQVIDDIVMKVVQMNDNLVARVNHVDGKEDSKIVKSYFKKLREDWEKGIEEIMEEVGKL